MTQEFWYDGRLYEVDAKHDGIALVRLPNDELIRLHVSGDLLAAEPMRPGMLGKAHPNREEASKQTQGAIVRCSIRGVTYFASSAGGTAFYPRYVSLPDGSVWESGVSFVETPVLHARRLETVAFRADGRLFRTKRPVMDYFGFSWLVMIDDSLYQLTWWFNGINVTRIDVNVAVPADSDTDLYN